MLALLLTAVLTAPAQVTVGLELRNVEAVDLQENAYRASVVHWLIWSGELETDTIRFANLHEAWGLTTTPVTAEPVTLPDGRRYQRFVSEGRFFHKLELGAFPLDRQQLVVELEDVAHAEAEVQLVLDPSSRVDSTLSVPGWVVEAPIFEVRSAVAESGYGLGAPVQHSRARFGVSVRRPWRVFFVTMFPPILLVVLCCWFVFFLRPIHVEARVGTVITALLTTVFLQLAFTDDLPYLGTTVLLDQVFNYSYLAITAVLAECVVVMRWHDRAVALEQSLASMPVSEQAAVDSERRRVRVLAEGLDRRAMWAFPVLYLLGCAAIVGWHLGG